MCQISCSRGCRKNKLSCFLQVTHRPVGRIDTQVDTSGRYVQPALKCVQSTSGEEERCLLSQQTEYPGRLRGRISVPGRSREQRSYKIAFLSIFTNSPSSLSRGHTPTLPQQPYGGPLLPGPLRVSR